MKAELEAATALVHQDVPPDPGMLQVVMNAGTASLAQAGPGALVLEALAAQARKGVVCVRSTRVATGRVGRNVEVDDDKLGLIASDDLNPQKARVLLGLALVKPRTLAELQRLSARGFPRREATAAGRGIVRTLRDERRRRTRGSSLTGAIRTSTAGRTRPDSEA